MLWSFLVECGAVFSCVQQTTAAMREECTALILRRRNSALGHDAGLCSSCVGLPRGGVQSLYILLPPCYPAAPQAVYVLPRTAIVFLACDERSRRLQNITGDTNKAGKKLTG